MIDTEMPQGRHVGVRPSRSADAEIIGCNLRKADRLELERSFVEFPVEVVRNSIRNSFLAWTAFIPQTGEPVAVWGVCRDMNFHPLAGIGWTLMARAADKYPADIMRLSLEYDRIICSYFQVVCNMVDAEYTQAQRWLDRLGYAVGPTVNSNLGFPFVLRYKNPGLFRMAKEVSGWAACGVTAKDIA